MKKTTESWQIKHKNIADISSAESTLYETMSDSIHAEGLQAILKFLHESGKIDLTKPFPEQLADLDERFHIKCYAVQLEKNWYQNISLPMLVKKKQGAYAVVLPALDGSAVLADTRKKIRSDQSGLYETTAFCFYKVFDSHKVSLHTFCRFLFKSISVKEAIFTTFISIMTVFAGLILPWANKFVYEKIIPTGNMSDVLPAAALVFSAVSVAFLFKLLQSFILSNCTLRMNAYVQSSLYDRLLALKPDFFADTKSGELANIITEFSGLSKIVSVKSLSALVGMCLSVIYLIQIRFYAPSLLVFVILTALVIFALVVAEGIVTAKWQNTYSKSLSGLAGFCYEMFSGMEQIKLNGAEIRFFKRWSDRFSEVSLKENQPFLMKYGSDIRKFLLVLSTGGIYVLSMHLPLSEFVAFSAAYGAFIVCFAHGGNVVRMISGFKSEFKLVQPIMDGECETYSGEKLKPEHFQGNITVSDLCFSYKNAGYPVFNHLNLAVKAGESIGIAGPSGCGKSTLIRLLLGFESAKSGSIYIDNYDIRELHLQNYRKHLGVVLQNSSLIPGDIYENVTMMNPGATLPDILKALDMALIREDIEKLPLGLRTPLNTQMNVLSGGQIQRILIARALLGKPNILIFDEATSALDNVTQKAVMDNLRSLDCTKIFIAHRLSTLEHCDNIFVLADGRICESGTYENLLQKQGAFHRLVSRQMMEEQPG